MNSLLGSDEDEVEREQRRETGGDREISLGTTTLLGIFLALAVVCALFFGFGYTLGRHSAPQTAAAATPVASENAATAKPGAGSPLGGGKPAKPLTGPSASPLPTAPTPVATAAPPATGNGSPDPPPIAKPAPSITTRAPAATPPANVSGPPAIVQVAAVSHREDAELLVTTLKRRGYNVEVNTEPGDKLLHVQIGPLPNRKEADAMRQRLLADGFNAIVK